MVINTYPPIRCVQGLRNLDTFVTNRIGDDRTSIVIGINELGRIIWLNVIGKFSFITINIQINQSSNEITSFFPSNSTKF